MPQSRVPTSILIVEDDAILARMITRMLHDCAVEAVATVASAKAAMLRGGHDAWLVDYLLPDGDGIALLRWARASGLFVSAFVMTGVLDMHHVASDAQRLGAEFVFKTSMNEENLRAFLRRSDARTPLDRRTVIVAEAAKLSRQERRLLIAYVGGVSRHDLPAALGVAESTVVTHVSHVLRKTGAASLQDIRERILRDVRGTAVAARAVNSRLAARRSRSHLCGPWTSSHASNETCRAPSGAASATST